MNITISKIELKHVLFTTPMHIILILNFYLLTFLNLYHINVDIPSTSTRAVTAELEQLLTEDDYPRREQFICRMLDIITHSNPIFHVTALFTNEVSFTREDIVNTLNTHMWFMDNPCASVPWKSLQRFSVNVLVGFLGAYLLGLYLLPKRLNGATYLVSVQHVLP